MAEQTEKIKAKKYLRPLVIAVAGIVLIGIGMRFIPEFSHNSSLYEAIKDADKIVVEQYGDMNTADSRYGFKKAGEITDSAEVKEFTGNLKVYPEKMFGLSHVHACAGDYNFVFFNGNSCLTTINLGHGSLLQWNGWKGCHTATEECKVFLEKKLKKRNLKLDSQRNN
ncbi:MAG: hypothetical protein HZA48_01710 [Planctomycetes bacterium]|nr:hypothetical protein [Planctomycetota bacterium]